MERMWNMRMPQPMPDRGMSMPMNHKV